MARVLSAPGARDTEELLLQTIDADQERVAEEPRLLARPLRIVVPSRALRDHLCAAITRRRGAAAGVRVETHLQLAHSLLAERGEHPGATHDTLLDLLVRRRADEEPELNAILGELQLGYRAVVASATDLLHAELRTDQREPVEDAVAALGGGKRMRRTRAVVQASFDALERFGEAGLQTRDELLRRAGALLSGLDPGEFARAVLVHGYADATGVVSGFLERLLEHPESLLLLDRPRDPADPEREDLGTRFSRPFGERLGETPRSATPASCPPSCLSGFTAPGSRAEAREIARRIRTRLDAEDPPPPESIAVVTRTLGSRLRDFEEAFEDYGIPWQAPGTRGSVDPTGRRLLAFRELLLRKGRCPLSRWFEARGEELEAWRLRLGFAVLGVGRLAQLAELELEGALRGGTRLALPHRTGLYRPEDAPPGSARSARESLGAEELRGWKRAAGELLERLERLSEVRSFADCARLTREIATEHFGWYRGEETGEAERRWDAVLAAYPEDFALDGAEFLTLLHEDLDRAARMRGEAAGGGVRILDLVQARGLCFEHVYVVGLNRGSFPPVAREDPLLPDRIRNHLRAVLPDLENKLDRSREERFLFAQILSAAPALTLSWWSCDDDGRALPPSPFVQRLRPRLGDAVGSAPAPLETEADAKYPHPRPLREHLLQAALAQDIPRFTPLLAAALEAEGAPAPADAQAWARAATAVLAEYDRAPARAEDLGPWLGRIPPRDAGLPDPRAREFAVTSLERLAECPWAWFLEKILGLEAMPDPLEKLPGIESRWVGSVVHGALERLVESATGPLRHRGLDALDGPGVPLAWPEETRMQAWALDAARELLAEEGLALPGLARALALRARVHLEECRRLLFADGNPLVLGAEIRDQAAVPLGEDGELTVRFRADLVDRVEGELRLLDFKTGRSFVDAKGADTRRRRMLSAIARGEKLQGAVYALAAGSHTGRTGRGAYLFLRPDDPVEWRWAELRSDDAEVLESLSQVVGLLQRLERRGLLPPRLLDLEKRKEPSRCGYCEVAAACVRGDSTSRQRAESGFESLASERDSLRGDAALLLRAWELTGRAG